VAFRVPQFNGERAQIIENLQELHCVQSFRGLPRGESIDSAGDACLEFHQFRKNDLLEIVERGDHASTGIDVLGK
jgi:hypothetical protein